MGGRISRRRLIVDAAWLALGSMTSGSLRAAGVERGLDAEWVEETLARAREWPGLHTLLAAYHGTEAVARSFRGAGLDSPANIKSVAKSVMAALAGAAIDRGILSGVDQRIAPLLGDLVPADADERVGEITVDHLLTMRAGLQRTSGPNYGRWVSSSDWVRHALSRPFVAEPGGRMLYSTGSYHLLSAVLTRASDRSTLELAREWLGTPLGIEIPPWDRDPQGFYFGGNNMALSPRALLRFGEMYRLGGRYDGRQVLPSSWVEESWTSRTRSFFTGHRYGYGWFITRARGYPVYYAWGYGGQMIHVVPALALTVVMTSDPDSPSGRTGYARELHALVADGFIAAAEAAGGDGAVRQRDGAVRQRS
jgi:CubicO group peptidase (beta-lactamase class C family)